MRATEVLLGHHELIRSLLEEVTDPDGEVGDELVGRLMVELTLHETIEDEIFYPAMAQQVSGLVPTAHAEHRQLADQLAVVLRTPTDSERFAVEAAALRQAVEAHAGKEEREMFPDVESKVDSARLDEIGGALAARLDQLRRSKLTAWRLRLKRAVIRHTYASRGRST
jgi:hemerythrin-like domain-containing protein